MPLVGLLSAGAALLLVAVAPRYGWHRDELYFLEAGKHLAWGYIDQPPFTPFVARLADEVARHNLVVFRLVPALATAVTVILGSLIVRELGGERKAQVAGAAAVAGGGFALGAGHLLSTATFDLTAWMALLWLTARLLRTADPRWWLAIGGVAGVALLNKHLVVLLGAAVLAGLVVERRWYLLGSPWLAAGVVLAAAIAAPHLVWQGRNGWPQIEMAEALAERLATENRATLLPAQLLLVGPLLIPLLWWGARRLARPPAATVRRFRPLLWAWPVGLAVTFATGGRPYYPLALTVVVVLAGIVAYDQTHERARLLVWLIVPNALISIPLALPVLPLSTTNVSARVNEAVAETVGWPELVAQLARVVDDLPPSERRRVVLLTGSYGEAGAIDRFGDTRRLPPAYSAHNSYAEFRRPTDDGATVVAVHYPVASLSPYFARCTQVAAVDNGHDVDNEVQGQPIVVCHGLRATWEEVWSRLRHVS